MSAEYNLDDGYRFKARDNGELSRPLQSKHTPQSPQGHPDMQAHALKSLRDGVLHSFDHLTKPRSLGGAGVKLRQVEEEPYKSAGEMLEDLRKNRTLQVSDSWMQMDDPEKQAVGHPIEKRDEGTLGEFRTKPQEPVKLPSDPERKAQSGHITNRYRQFVGSHVGR